MQSLNIIKFIVIFKIIYYLIILIINKKFYQLFNFIFLRLKIKLN